MTQIYTNNNSIKRFLSKLTKEEQDNLIPAFQTDLENQRTLFEEAHEAEIKKQKEVLDLV
jgi:hypothetical protein